MSMARVTFGRRFVPIITRVPTWGEVLKWPSSILPHAAWGYAVGGRLEAGLLEFTAGSHGVRRRGRPRNTNF